MNIKKIYENCTDRKDFIKKYVEKNNMNIKEGSIEYNNRTVECYGGLSGADSVYRAYDNIINTKGYKLKLPKIRPRYFSKKIDADFEKYYNLLKLVVITSVYYKGDRINFSLKDKNFSKIESVGHIWISENHGTVNVVEVDINVR